MKVSVTSTGSLVEALDDLNKGLTKAQRDAANEVAKLVKPALLAEALHHRGTLSMSGMNISRLTVSSKVLSTPTHSTVIVRPGRMAGAWAIIEFGTRTGSPARRTWSRATATLDEGPFTKAITDEVDEVFQ